MTLSDEQRTHVRSVVEGYKRKWPLLESLRNSLLDAITSTKPLMDRIHSIKDRIKDPEHLEKKIYRNAEAYFTSGGNLKLTDENLVYQINDLIGLRLIHLHPAQFAEIDDRLRQCLNDNNYILREGPTARVWDDEQRGFYEEMNVRTQPSRTLYTSVHYIISTRPAPEGATAEIQVRTLADELWGEVSHSINYPEPTGSQECREQIAVLARLTSAASRLTDTIFLTQREFELRKPQQ